MAVKVFLATAGELFAAHPFREVELAALRPRMAATHWPRVEATLTPHEPAHDFWPLALFPERETWSVVGYENWAAALADLSRRAAGYGRRMAGVVVEPPPLPRAKRAEAPTGRPEGYGIAGAAIA